MKIINSFKKYQKKAFSYSNRKLFGPILRWLFIYINLDQRYRFLNTNSMAIGHLCIDVDCFLREWTLKKLKFKGVLLANRKKAANSALVKIWKATPGLVVVENPVCCYFFDYLRVYKETGYDCNKYCALDGQAAEVYKIRNSEGIPDLMVSWPNKLLERAQRLFKKAFPEIDIERCVVLHSRDSIFDERIQNSNYNSQRYRNSDLTSYKLILAFLKERGYTVIRIGEYSKNSIVETDYYLQIPEMELFEKNLLELFVVSRCKIFLGSASGASDMASLWGRPVFRLNTLPYAMLRPHYSQGMGIPKLLYLKGNLLKVEDIFARGYHWFRNDSQYQNHGIDIRINDPSDCIEDFIEFFEVFVLGNKSLKYELENSSQQYGYKKLCPSDSYDYYARSFIPRNFFNKYNILL